MLLLRQDSLGAFQLKQRWLLCGGRSPGPAGCAVRYCFGCITGLWLWCVSALAPGSWRRRCLSLPAASCALHREQALVQICMPGCARQDTWG